MSKKFDRVLSNEDLLDVYRSLDNPKHDRDSVIEAMGAAVDAAMAKLVEQVPVAWINAKKLETMHKDKRFNRVLWQTVLRVDKVEDNEIPLYAHPIPCVSNASDKAACVSENRESETQELPPLPKPNCRSPSGIGYFDSFTKDQMIDYAKSAIEHHRTTKNHIVSDNKMVGSDHIPDISNDQDIFRLRRKEKEQREAISEWLELKDKIKKSGRPPHADYWNQAIYEAENKLRLSIQD